MAGNKHTPIVSGSLSESQLAEKYRARAENLMALAQGKSLETVAVHGSAFTEDKNILRRLNLILTELAAKPFQAFSHGGAESIIGKDLAQALDWSDVTLAWLTGS